MIKVTVIVTLYNQANTLERTLNSILIQKCNFQYEIIIGNDFSSDNSKDICDKYKQLYPNIIKSIHHNENLGVGANFALCIQKAQGEFIAICAADDYWHNPDKLQIQVDFLENNPDCGLLYTDYDRYNIKTKKLIKEYLKYSKKKIFEGSNLFDLIFYSKVPILTLTVMLRNSTVNNYVPLNDYIKYRFSLEDWPTWIILSKYTKICYLPVSTSTYCYSHQSITNPTNYDYIIKRLKQDDIMARYLCKMFPNDLHYDENYFSNYTDTRLLNLAYIKNDFPFARKYSERLTTKGQKSLKVTFAKFKVTFKLFYLFKFIRKYIEDYI